MRSPLAGERGKNEGRERISIKWVFNKAGTYSCIAVSQMDRRCWRHLCSGSSTTAACVTCVCILTDVVSAEDILGLRIFQVEVFLPYPNEADTPLETSGNTYILKYSETSHIKHIRGETAINIFRLTSQHTYVITHNGSIVRDRRLENG